MIIDLVKVWLNKTTGAVAVNSVR